MGCINKNLKDNQRLIQDFSETRVNQLFDEYFQDENPSYGEFISNPNVKEALGIIPISKVKSEIGKAFGKEISSRELKILKKSISNINDKLLGHSYKLFNIKQKGESDNYSWGLRKINSNINIQAKIDRLKQRINTGKQIRNLEDNQFNFPDINQTIKSNTTNSNKVELFNQQTLYQKQTQSQEGLIASEKTIRDLAARMSDRIGIPVRFESDRSKEYKGKLENGTAIVNLAYATLDSPIHEILAHPIIRAIKNRSNYYKEGDTAEFHGYGDPERVTITKIFDDTLEVEFRDSKGNIQKADLFELTKTQNTLLYQNLLKELEYGKGKEVLERVKRDYSEVTQKQFDDALWDWLQTKTLGSKPVKVNSVRKTEPNTFSVNALREDGTTFTWIVSETDLPVLFSKEEQQEEAIVELMSLMVADKLNKITDKNLISLLKQLLKQINDFIKSLLNTKELNINDIEADNNKFLIENKLKELIKNETIKKEC